MDNQKELKRIEDKLSIYLATDRRNWAETYLLMKEVRDKELYAENYKSFTQWVNELADRNHYHQSTLWSRFKAGNVYEEYAQRQREAGKTNVKTIEEVDISPDTFALSSLALSIKALQLYPSWHLPFSAALRMTSCCSLWMELNIKSEGMWSRSLISCSILIRSITLIMSSSLRSNVLQ